MTERRLVFGEVAGLYDDMRPRYPDRLVDDVLGYAGVGPGETMLEVGAGTGIASRGFAARGVAVHAVEPSAAMAEVLLARAADPDAAPDADPDAAAGTGSGAAPAPAPAPITVDVAPFERWTPPHPFPLLAAAQSWHWVDPAVRYRRAHAALRPGGAIALFGHRPRPAGALGDEIDQIYADLVPEHHRGPYHADVGYGLEFAAELAAEGLFEAVESREYTFRLRYDTAGFLRLSATMSDFRVIEPERRDRLRGELARLLDRAGGAVDVDYRTDLHLARRR